MGEHPARGAQPDHHDDNEANDSTAQRLNAASQAIVELEQRIDHRTAERERTARTLAGLARLCHERGTLDSRIAGALRVVGAALDVSSERLRQAVADAIDGETSA